MYAPNANRWRFDSLMRSLREIRVARLGWFAIVFVVAVSSARAGDPSPEIALDQLHRLSITLQGPVPDISRELRDERLRWLVTQYLRALGDYHRAVGSIASFDGETIGERDRSHFFRHLRRWDQHTRLAVLRIVAEQGPTGMSSIISVPGSETIAWNALIGDLKHFAVPALVAACSSSDADGIAKTAELLDTIFEKDYLAVLEKTIRSDSDPIAAVIFENCLKIAGPDSAFKGDRAASIRSLIHMLGVMATMPAAEDALRLFSVLDEFQPETINLLAVIGTTNDLAGERILEYLLSELKSLDFQEMAADGSKVLDALKIILPKCQGAHGPLARNRASFMTDGIEQLLRLRLDAVTFRILEPDKGFDESMQYWNSSARGNHALQNDLDRVMKAVLAGLPEDPLRHRAQVLKPSLQAQVLQYFEASEDGRSFRYYPVVRDTVLGIVSPVAPLMGSRIIGSILSSYENDAMRQHSGKVRADLEILESALDDSRIKMNEP